MPSTTSTMNLESRSPTPSGNAKFRSPSYSSRQEEFCNLDNKIGASNEEILKVFNVKDNPETGQLKRLLLACFKEDDVRDIKLVQNINANISANGRIEETLLQLAFRRNKPNVLKCLLRQGKCICS